MRSLDDLRFIRDRVIAEWVTNRQGVGPLLGERWPKPSKACKRGHEGAARDAQGHCYECERERKRRKA